MDTPSRNPRSRIEEPQVSWLFDENGDVEEDLFDGAVVENSDYETARS